MHTSIRTTLILLACALLAASAGAADPAYTIHMQPLPGASADGISIDYILFDPATKSVWVPAGNTGAVDVVDPATGTVRQITGFPTSEIGNGEHKRVVGPSSVATGDGSMYIANRGDFTICKVNPKTLERGLCRALDSMPDAMAYVAATKELWVTAPRDKSIRILDSTTLEQRNKVIFQGNPEGFALDVTRGRIYTNMEDQDRTLAIDVKTHKIANTWKPGCGDEGPHGLRVDAKAGHLFVACSARVLVMDTQHDGAVLSSIDTGDGVDDIDYDAKTHLLYIGAAKAGTLTVASVDATGKLTIVATVPTHLGARNPAVTSDGTVFLAHSELVKLSDLVVAVPKK